MKDKIDNISVLQEQLNNLQIENKILKEILEHHKVDYVNELKKRLEPETLVPYEENQASRIIHPQFITKDMAIQFYAMFWGRQDVYAKRYENKEGKIGYYPQCNNFWTNVCLKKYDKKGKCKDCQYASYKELCVEDVIHHLSPSKNNDSNVLGVYPLLLNGTCRFMVFDFDNHDKEANQLDYGNVDDDWICEVETLRFICKLNGLDPLVERSRSGKGAHIWLFFDKPISAKIVRSFGFALLEKGAEMVNLKSFKYYDRMLPAQDHVNYGGFGNLIALPLQGNALLKGNSAFVDENWNAYPNQWELLLKKPKLSQAFLELKIKEWTGKEEISDKGKPWKHDFDHNDVNGKLHITIANGIFVDTTNLNANIQNQIRRLAVIHNPDFYKNQAIGLSTYNVSRFLYYGYDHLNGYIQIPRGLYDSLISHLEKAHIDYDIDDERICGNQIHVKFNGILKEEQSNALNTILKYEHGILRAATSFGKTVVSAAMIAKKKVNTLIIIESSSLMDQWVESLHEFLDIDEELPTYQTKTGRIKTRKSIIGQLHGSHDSMTGIVDVAMFGSLCKSGTWHSLLKTYGMIIIDECHHVASDSFIKVIEEIQAKYVYGVTANSKRSDGRGKVNEMFIGPIRYQYTSLERAKAQDIDHLVYPRFTRTIIPRGIADKMSPNEAYEILRNDKNRDEIIVEDIKDCILHGRSCIVLSKYIDHCQRLYHLLEKSADHVVLLTGGIKKKATKEIIHHLKTLPEEDSLILIATGSFVGEGFSLNRLDTLIMAMPVAFETVVEQYSGRINRDYSKKENVIIYDYVDRHIPMFDRMYAKRLKTYKKIGFDVCTNLVEEKQEINAIFDSENYKDAFVKDLLEANKNIVISSPVISATKVYEMIDLLATK